MRTTPKYLVITVLALAAMAGTTLWMFRSRTDSDDDRGVVTYRWRWGRATDLAVDRDRDGRADVKVIYPGYFGEFASDDPPRELWADQNLDGRFDVTWHREAELVFRRDVDFDGVFETVLRGAEAESARSNLKLFE